MRTIGWIWLLLKKHYLFSKVSSEEIIDVIVKYRDEKYIKSIESVRDRNVQLINYKYHEPKNPLLEDAKQKYPWI